MRLFTSGSTLIALGALFLVACPSTETCPDGTLWYPDRGMCLPPQDGGIDTGMSDGGSDASGDTGLCSGTCGGTTPFCRTSDDTCVACLEATDCDGANNACVDGECLPCDSNDDCEDLAAAQCNTTTNTCEACTGNAACTGRTGTEVCAAGECVECSAADETACGANVCNLLTSECETAVTPGSVALCGACTNDRACMTGQVCAPTEFPVGSGTEVGNFCLWRLDAAPGPAGACSRVPPYGREDPVMTVSGVSTSVCGPAVSTCTALLNFRAIPCGTAGTMPPATPEAACGIPAVDDGFCRVRDAASNRCTVACTTYDDCPCVDGTCARQYECQSNRCDFTRTCDTTTGTCG
jgi:hypothetical protein